MATSATSNVHPPDAVTATVGQVFPDGTSIDLVFDRSSNALQLLLWNAGKITIAPEIKHDGRVYRPAAVDPSVLNACGFPTHCAEYGSPLELLDDISGLFESYVDIGEPSARLLGYFVLATWFVDCLPFAPSVLLAGAAVSEIDVVLRLLASLCRRSLILSELTVPHFFSIPFSLQPTLLIEQGRVNRALSGLLRASSRHGFHPHNGKLMHLFCAKVIYVREISEHLSLDALEIAINPSSGKKPILTDVALERIAADFQPKLLHYRLKNVEEVAQSAFDVCAFSAATREVARSFGACVTDPKLQSALINLLQEYDKTERAEESIRLECIVLQAVLFLCHKNEKSVLVNGVAKVVNALLADRGVSVVISAKGVGVKLKSLGLHSERLGSCGRGIVLTKEVKSQVHRLALAYDLTAAQAVAGCPECGSAGQVATGMNV